MVLHQGLGTLAVPPGVVVIHFFEELTKAPAIRAHNIGCCKVALLGPLLALAVKFGKCISRSCSVRNLDYINFLLDDLAMHPYGGSDRLDAVNARLKFLQVVIN